MDKNGGMSPTFQRRPSSSHRPGNADHSSGGIMGSIKVINHSQHNCSEAYSKYSRLLGWWWAVSLVSKRRKGSQFLILFHVKQSTWLWDWLKECQYVGWNDRKGSDYNPKGKVYSFVFTINTILLFFKWNQ